MREADPVSTELREQDAKGERHLPDRILGGEWGDWTGDLTAHEGDLSEGVGAFLLLGGFVLAVGGALALFIWWLASPRLSLLHPDLPRVGGTALLAGLSGMGIWWGVVSLAAFRILPPRLQFAVPRRLSQRILNVLLGPAVRLGKTAGLSRDRCFSSFIKVSNALACGFGGRALRGKMLLLLPRCMRRSVRREVMGIASKYPLEVRTAGGGTGARRHVNEVGPAAIVCVACERDLVSGIQDVAVEIPVWAIANRRPYGPCKDTVVDPADVERGILHMMARVGGSELGAG